MTTARRSIAAALVLVFACAHGDRPSARPAADTTDDAGVATPAPVRTGPRGEPAADRPAPAADPAGVPDGASAGPPSAALAETPTTVPAAAPAPPPARPPDDPLDALYRPALALGPDRRPRVSVRLMEAQARIAVRAQGGALVAELRPQPGEPARTVRAPEGEILRVAGAAHEPGEVRTHPVLAEIAPGDVDALTEILQTWRRRGEAVRVETVGTVFGLAGRVVDNRRTLVLADGPGGASWARETRRRLAGHLPEAPRDHEILVRRPSARLQLVDAQGARLASADSLVTFSAEGGGFVEVLQVEHGIGYEWHGRQDRGYEGEVYVVADRAGLSAVNAVPLETLLRGLVPAEIYASAHPEALKAQAVTARGEVLAKIGVRHLANPALLCAEQHCQVYKGRGATTATTDAAVAATAGEVLIGPDGRLVDAVYSAVCGGFTENNEVPWGGAPKPALRGRADFDAEGPWLRFAAGIGEDDLEAWLAASPPTWCNRSSFRNPGKFRWTRRIPAADMDRYVATLGVGAVRAVEVLGRGVSGRVKAVRFVGSRGAAVVHREWPIRKLLGNLPSGAFVVEVEPGGQGRPGAFVFRGAGWGHGVGMCQTGAIGMAEHGHDYRRILRHYYNGAEVVPIY